MEIQSIITSLPKSSAAYIFGSFLRSASPNDIDVLIVYDPQFCAPALAYALHRDSVEQIERAIGIAADVTLLTKDEEHECDFINDTGAVPLASTDIARLLK